MKHVYEDRAILTKQEFLKLVRTLTEQGYAQTMSVLDDSATGGVFFARAPVTEPRP